LLKIKFYKLIIFSSLIIIFLLALSGCEGNAIRLARNSNTPEEELENYKAYLAKYPDGVHVKEASNKIETIKIRFAGQGIGFPEAPAYDSNDPGTIKLFIIEKYEASKPLTDEWYDEFKKHEWNENLPANLSATTINDASLYCILKSNGVLAGSQEYYRENSHSSSTNNSAEEVKAYKVITDIEIREARTGDILFTGSLEGSDPVFTGRVESKTIYTPTIEGDPPSYSSFESWLFKTLK
jgi:hypothetical protein